MGRGVEARGTGTRNLLLNLDAPPRYAVDDPHADRATEPSFVSGRALMLGMTWSATLDAALDEISRLQRERDNALDQILEFMKTHPEFEGDVMLCEASLALL